MKKAKVQRIVDAAWEDFLHYYADSLRCEDEFRGGRRRAAKLFTYLPWNELDIQFFMANRIAQFYRRNGEAAEIHHQWNLRNRWGLDSRDLKLLSHFALNRKFDMYVSSPYSIWGTSPFAFDIIAEFKMYREGKATPYYPWADLRPQLQSLLMARNHLKTKVPVAFLVNRGGLNERRWQDIVRRSSRFIARGVKIYVYNPGPYSGEVP